MPDGPPGGSWWLCANSLMHRVKVSRPYMHCEIVNCKRLKNLQIAHISCPVFSLSRFETKSWLCCIIFPHHCTRWVSSRYHTSFPALHVEIQIARKGESRKNGFEAKEQRRGSDETCVHKFIYPVNMIIQLDGGKTRL